MPIRWTPDAVDDLKRITEYIDENSPDSALRVARRICGSVASLAKSPSGGRIGWVEGTRELVLALLPYVVVYRIKDEVVEILHVHHGAQNWRQ
jgi:toxin ParE1/3/4